jgi:L-fucose isomerase-like protein
VADDVYAQLDGAGYVVGGTGARLLMDEEGAQAAIEALEESGIDLLILLQASFADSTMAVSVTRSVAGRGIPLLLWAVPDTRDGGRLRLNSLCGINLAGHALTQQGIRYQYLHLAADDPEALSMVGRLARAGSARRQLQQVRIGLIGEHPAGFETCAYDADHLETLFGAQVVPLALDSTLHSAATAGSEGRSAFLERAGRYASNLDQLDQRALQGTAGVHVALEEAVAGHRLNGVAVRCWPEFFTELGCAACGAMSMLNEEMCPASCEADVNGTLTSILLQTLSGSQAFITDLVSIDAQDNSGVLWHCGLAPVSMADPDEPVVGTVHSNRKLPLLFEFALKPGRVTIARLHRSALKNGLADYRLVIGGGEMLRAPKSFGGTSGVIRFDSPASEVLDVVMNRGLEHHFNITYGDVREELRVFADLVGLEVIELT